MNRLLKVIYKAPRSSRQQIYLAENLRNIVFSSNQNLVKSKNQLRKVVYKGLRSSKDS